MKVPTRRAAHVPPPEGFKDAVGLEADSFGQRFELECAPGAPACAVRERVEVQHRRAAVTVYYGPDGSITKREDFTVEDPAMSAAVAEAVVAEEAKRRGTRRARELVTGK